MHGPMHGRTGTATYTGDWIHGKIKVGVIKIAGLSSADFTYSNNCRQMSVSLTALTVRHQVSVSLTALTVRQQVSVSLTALTVVRCLFHLQH